MPKPLRVLLLILLWIFVLGGGFVLFWFRETNVLPPPIERSTDPQTRAH